VMTDIRKPDGGSQAGRYESRRATRIFLLHAFLNFFGFRYSDPGFYRPGVVACSFSNSASAMPTTWSML
jgi:hypothetical protein